MKKSQVQKFLDELAELTLKHGLTIGGCGCCGSPYVETLSTKDEVGNKLWYDYEKHTYTLELDGDVTNDEEV